MNNQLDQNTFSSPQGTFTLERFPVRHNLQAWDAADEYLLNHLAEIGGPTGSLLIINDSFGALACALADSEPTSWSDSFLAHQAALQNLAANNIDPASLLCLPSTDLPFGDGDDEDAEEEGGAVSSEGDTEDRIGTVLIKIPKTLALLEYQLGQIRPFVDEQTVIIGAGMVKHIHTSTLELFEKILGPTTTSRATKKARLSFTTFDPDLNPGPVGQPTSYEFGSGLAAVTMPGVFANRKLDIGTRFFLEHLPAPGDGDVVLDLGCGNGILGVSAAKANPNCSVVFTDNSYLAVASAQATAVRAFDEERDDKFVVADGADAVEDASVDLVVINPPFHDQYVVGDETARQMFADAGRVLKPGGQLLVVANRHLGHHKAMNNVFGNVKTLASNPKFVVLRSNKA